MGDQIEWHTKPCSVHGHCLLIGPSTGRHELSLQMPIETAELIVRACTVFADIEEGVSMIVEKNHYYQLESQAKSQPDLLSALRPFAEFACDDWEIHGCFNCIAKQVIAKAE